jgi:hypothetical protein
MNLPANSRDAGAWWEYREEGRLVLHLGERHDAVPADVAKLLMDPRWQRLTADVAADVLRLEAELRGLEHRLTAKVDDAARAVVQQRQHVEERGVARFTRGRAARAVLQAAVEAHSRMTDMRSEVVSYREILRSFVIALEPREGLLAEAVAGWLRSPDVPAGVPVFQDEDYFLTDSRRAAGPGGFPNTIGGEVFGDLWRRDGDDPVDQPLSRPGCWLVGYIERTREIYAVRRGEGQRREVWLLGRGFSSEQAHQLLQPLMARMQEPNSVILVAESVATAAPAHAFCLRSAP